jgi:ubiquitin carboxyl-terminal hydrolase 8
MLLEWNDLRNVMWSGNGVVTPKKFVYNVQKIAQEKDKDIFTGWAQNDMPEFLLFFMECIHNSISRSVNMKISGQTENQIDEMAIKCYTMLQTIYSKEYSEIMDMFYGIYVSEIISKNGKIRHVMKPENYFVLDLPVHDPATDKLATNIYDCFDTFIKPELLEGENAWFNEAASQKEDVKKQISFWNFPKVFIVMFKRFTPDGENKINSLIDFPLENLDLSRYVRGYNASNHVYDLFGICNHMGGVNGGHYTAFVKNYENKWFHYNDRSVELVENLEQMVSPMAYCLFYRKKNNLL